MNQSSGRVIVVHDNEGLTLAVMLVEEHTVEQGVRTGHRPVLREGQHMAEIDLDQEQRQVRLHELLQYQVSYTGEKPTLRRRVRS
jgi:hypothetical protein